MRLVLTALRCSDLVLGYSESPGLSLGRIKLLQSYLPQPDISDENTVQISV